ncbi:MAG: hypothetical protein ABEI76_02710 [Halobacteriales archaeon]
MTILIPIDISESDPPALDVVDLLFPFEVILLGYFPVPDQAEPALIKHEYEDEAGARLDTIAAGRTDVTEVLVFTHDREATIDRVADEYGCDAVLTAGDTDHIDRILVPIRGDANIERIVAVVAELLREGDATATFFHSVSEDDEASQGEFLLRGTVERVTDYGIDHERVEWQLSEAGTPLQDIVALGAEYDLLVLGETEPSLRERIIGDVLSRIIDEIDPQWRDPHRDSIPKHPSDTVTSRVLESSVSPGSRGQFDRNVRGVEQRLGDGTLSMLPHQMGVKIRRGVPRHITERTVVFIYRYRS